MSKESVLKKQFQEKDIQRLRNVVSGKHGDKTTMGTGYTKAKEFYKEGDVWTENGREWTIKDGIKQNITKLDKAKELTMPMFCPSCGGVMKHKFDPLFWKNHRRCYNCVVEFETRLKTKGLWTEYQTQINNNAIDNFIQEYQLWAEEMLTQSNQGFISEEGEVQNWKGGVNKKLMQQSTDEVIKYLESLKK